MKCNSLDEWEKNNEILLKKMDEWRDTYTCEHSCEEWQKWKFCEHLVKDRTKKFKKEIGFMMSSLAEINIKALSEINQSSESFLQH